ncbi:hypothetical protein [Methylobacterium indicum]|uniref:Uncharacterized protein n=1 Tax=Methylobacterium indicum TaxID=1775910 RepID=A0A8H8X0R2_9HYPH|nr:hypothetical protein [Methylobacterium indicum]BCM87757.1 hypothetical protein mvi_62180 [Methylobacterium indicum]
MFKSLIIASILNVSAVTAFAQGAPAIDPKATVTLTYVELTSLVQAEVAGAEARRAMQAAQVANTKLQEAFAPKPTDKPATEQGK